MTDLSIENFSIDKSDWKTVKFGDIVFEPKESAKNPEAEGINHVVGLEHIDSEDLKLRRSGDIEEGTTFTKCFRKGDVLFGRRRAYLKKAARAAFDGICSGDIIVMRAKQNVLMPELLPFIVNNEKFFDFAVKHSAGGLSPRVKFKDLSSLELLIPNLEQQPEIIRLLNKIESVVESKRVLVDKLNTLVGSTFKQMLASATSASPVQVAQLLVDGPTNGFSPKSNSDGKGSKTVSIGAVKNGIFDPRGYEKFAEVDSDVLRKFNIRESDVFIVRGNGNIDLCGRAGIATKNYDGMFYPDLLIRLRFDDSKVLPDFVAYQWNTIVSHKRLIRSAKSTNGIWKVNGADIKRHSLNVPSIDEQKTILEATRRAQQVKELNDKALVDGKALLKSIISQLF